ncbi:MAG: SDR family NAD(P)-dependent oxidoreductase [Solirubrobacterales bacterium]|nr:SDR family NAD(P)-dependent oxidoreductase [Solirubrobacterales bacterium]
MKILVTGASGFVGSHTVKALVQGGHEVRASARSTDRVRCALAPLDCADRVETVEADVTDEAGVRAALDGCDAVIHAAAAYTFDPRRGRELIEGNVRGAELVLGAACELGLDPVVHVSSYVALLPGSPPLTADSPLGQPPTAYARSKARSEQVARGLQAQGKPVTIVQPGMVWGPDDPALGESSQFARSAMKVMLPFAPPGSVPVVDVRDLAAVLAALLEAGRGPRRYLATGELVPLREIVRITAETTGRKGPRGTMPRSLVLLTGRLADGLQRVIPTRLPLGYQGPWTALHGIPCNASPTTRELGVRFRPAQESIADTAHWLIDHGHLTTA